MQHYTISDPLVGFSRKLSFAEAAASRPGPRILHPPVRLSSHIASFSLAIRSTHTLIIQYIFLIFRNTKNTGLGLKWCSAVPIGTVRSRPIRPFLNSIAS